MEKKEKEKKLKKWFNVYRDMFIAKKDRVSDEQIEVYNEMAKLVGEPEYKKPLFKYVKVKLSDNTFVMKQVPMDWKEHEEESTDIDPSLRRY